MRSQSNPRRTSGRLSALFLVLVLVLALVGSSQIILVLALYLCMLFAGLSLAVYIIYSVSTWNFSPFAENYSNFVRSSKGSDVVSSLNVYVKFASRGSGHSRREIAYLLRNIVANQNLSRKLGNLDSRRQVEEDLDKIVNPYVSDNLGNPNSKAKNLGFKTKASKVEREAYLATLERVVRILSS
ncbi:MAG: hypothetical protein ACHQ1H_08200 [Nitrososphaerales archaeon]